MIFLDFETRSAADLPKTGVSRYVEDPTTEPILMSFAILDGPPETWFRGDPFPESLREALDRGDVLVAHNAGFERRVWEGICVPRYGWPTVERERWICTSAISAVYGLPRSLGDAGETLGLPIQKDREGAKLMKKLCKVARK